MSQEWYFAEGSRTLGPISLEELTNRLIKKRDGTETLVWREGMSDWTPAKNIEAIKFPVSPPPLPSSRPRTAPPSIPRTASDNPNQSNNLLRILGSIVAAVIGFGIARVAGAEFWIPVLLLAIAFFISKKIITNEHLVPVYSATLGHGLWFIFGVVVIYYLGSRVQQDILYGALLDIVVVIALLIWLYLRPSKHALIGLVIYEVIGLAANIYTIAATPNPRLSMFMHVAIRLFIIGASIYAMNRMSKIERPLT